ncbi:MAG TPA: fasciclin domain-containing protein [Chitinophagaceae bacterium]|nr:fasciclin domain-containing protein [Chitinophagaceae bacterium]
MKKIKRAGVFKQISLAILGIAVTFSSCKKDDSMSSNSAASQTIGVQVASNSSFSLLKSAAVKAGLVTVLEGTGPFTVFAPTDGAFQASGIDAAQINTLTADQLKAILLYHTLSAKIASSDVPAGPNAKVITAGGDSVFVTKNAKGVFVNGINVVNADLPASNGVIHTISRVLLPPSGNLVQVASSDTTFSFLVAAVVRASQGSTDVTSLLSNGGIFTVFAPTNNAFRAAGFADIAAINAADPDVLAGILAYHVIPGRIFSSDLTNGATPATANAGKTVTISLSGDTPSVKGQSNTAASNIIATNIMATNGVIHVIDRVLLP